MDRFPVIPDQALKTLGFTDAIPATNGTRRVYIDRRRDLVLKLFEDHQADELRHELWGHALGEEALPDLVPEIIDASHRPGYGFMIMRKVEGVALDTIYDRLGMSEKSFVISQLNAAREKTYALRVMDRGHWPAGIRHRFRDGEDITFEKYAIRQLAATVDRERDLGCPSGWLGEIGRFLAPGMGASAIPDDHVFMHTELDPRHVFVRSADDLTLTGIIDWENAMVAPKAYEQNYVSMTLCCPHRILLDAMGYSLSPGDSLRWLFIYRWCGFRRHLRRIPPVDGACSLQELAHQWWPG